MTRATIIRGFVTAAAIVAGLAAIATPSLARYGQVMEGLAQWEWVPTVDPFTYQIMDVAVRSDGWLIVSTGYRQDGYLYNVPPWGGELANYRRLGTPRGYRQLEMRDGRLYGLRHDPDRGFGNTGILDEIDADTGNPIRELGEFWYQDLALDPRTGNFVLQALGDGSDAFAHPVVSFDPDTGHTEVLIPDSDPRADQPLELAFSPDGSRLYAGHRTSDQIDVYDRTGALLFSMQTPGPVDALVHGMPGTCLADALMFTRSDGTVWIVRDPQPDSTPRSLASGERLAAVSFATMTPEGHILTPRLAIVTLLACPPFEPPVPPPFVRPPPAPPPTTAPQIEVAAPRPEPPSPPQPPAAASPPQPPPPAQPPPAPPTPNFASPAQLSAPNAGIADSPESRPVLSLSASARLLLGAAAVTAMAAGAYTVTRQESPVPPTAADLHVADGKLREFEARKGGVGT